MIASVKPLPKLKKNPPTSSSKPSQLGSVLGSFGEQLAALFLKNQGFQIIDRNVRVGGGEIDLIVWDSQTHELVIVEVKTRRQVYSGDPSFAVDYRKMRALRRATNAYISEIWRKHTATPTPYRIDILAVSPGKINHYRNVSW